ncbi:MAG TPA: hypothetical protein QF861_18710 [Alphaproteobacteria bacterium]|nr:hypothetical protein [Alphaproteobacteria bacterium]
MSGKGALFSRREALRLGLLASLLPGSATAATGGFLMVGDRALFGALAPVLLAGALPIGKDRAAAIEVVVAGVERAVAGLPLSTQAELRQLFDLLGFAPTRLLLTGLWDDWPEISPERLDAFLVDWRQSSIGLLRVAYFALHELVFAAWYGNPQSWSRIGYPGPPELS